MFQPALTGLSVAILVLTSATVTVRAADEPKAKVNVKTDANGKVNASTNAATERDIVYTKVGERELKLDVAPPSTGAGPFPAVLVIHGGAWRAGNKSDVGPVLLEFAKRGYVAISPEYRFCPKEVFPAQVHDVKAAVRWIKTHAKKYRIDPERIGAIGFSAGGHLALMLGVTGPDDGLEGEVSAGSPDSRVRAVVNYFGPTDLGAKDIPEVSKPLVKDFLGVPPPEKPELAAKASPRTYVSKGDAAILTFQGTKDPLVPFTQAIELAEAMTAAGVAGRVELLVGAQHGWSGAELERSRAETFRFFDRYLQAGTGSSPP
jgi:acetyl esterase/lipase